MPAQINVAIVANIAKDKANLTLFFNITSFFILPQ